jgi:2-dehydropantoate 2-reductase
LKYIIQGAGAVGSAIGASLARVGIDVTLVSRKPHTAAIKEQHGIYCTTLNGTELQPINAVEAFSEIDMPGETVIFQTMKANDTEASLVDLKGINPDTPVVCWQNGVDNEAIVGKVFKRVYGGVVRFTATMMTPGETRFAGTGKLILGRYPEGIDDLTLRMVADLSRTGYTVLASKKIMQDKWLKLLVNLISCIKPMTVKTDTEPEQRVEICRCALEEGIFVLSKAGIKAASTNKTEDSAGQMLSKFENTLALADGIGQGMDLLNSTHQSLLKNKKALENDWYTGKIITLGEQVGVPTPYNKAILYYLHRMAELEMGPESVEVERIIEKAEEFARE